MHREDRSPVYRGRQAAPARTQASEKLAFGEFVLTSSDKSVCGKPCRRVSVLVNDKRVLSGLIRLRHLQ